MRYLRPFITLLAMAGLTACACTTAYAQSKQIKMANASPTATFKGDDLYLQFCAVCHGADARGNGPAASALKVGATDLTQISRRNNGKFPTLHMKNVVTGVDRVAAHGSAEMPMWGDTFKSISANGTFGEMRVEAVVEYLQEIQR